MIILLTRHYYTCFRLAASFKEHNNKTDQTNNCSENEIGLIHDV